MYALLFLLINHMLFFLLNIQLTMERKIQLIFCLDRKQTLHWNFINENNKFNFYCFRRANKFKIKHQNQNLVIQFYQNQKKLSEIFASKTASFYSVRDLKSFTYFIQYLIYLYNTWRWPSAFKDDPNELISRIISHEN